MFDLVRGYLEQQQWQYHSPSDDKNIILFGVSTQRGKFHCVLDINEDENKFIFFSIFPINVTLDLRSSIAEVLVRLNYILFLGSFEMDFEDGEIRFKTSLIYEDGVVTEKMLGHIVNGNISTMDEHFELINSFIVGKISLANVVEAIDKMK